MTMGRQQRALLPVELPGVLPIIGAALILLAAATVASLLPAPTAFVFNSDKEKVSWIPSIRGNIQRV